MACTVIHVHIIDGLEPLLWMSNVISLPQDCMLYLCKFYTQLLHVCVVIIGVVRYLTWYADGYWITRLGDADDFLCLAREAHWTVVPLYVTEKQTQMNHKNRNHIKTTTVLMKQCSS